MLAYVCVTQQRSCHDDEVAALLFNVFIIIRTCAQHPIDAAVAAASPAGENSMDKADIKRLKESGVFGPLTFWVTEIKNLEEAGNPNAAVSVQHTADSTPVAQRTEEGVRAMSNAAAVAHCTCM